MPEQGKIRPNVPLRQLLPNVFPNAQQEVCVMDLSHLHEFVVFARCMNVSEAARNLHVAQPTLSNHLSALERELGCNLIARGHRPRLTAAGRELVAYASEILDSYDRMRKSIVEAQAKERVLSVCIESTSNCAHMNFTKVATLFMTRNRDSYMEMDYARHPSATAALDAGADCVVTCMLPLDEDVERGVAFTRLPDIFPHRLFLWVHEDNPLASKSELKWNDLHGKYPMTTQKPLWVAGCIQTFKAHGISAEVRANAQEDINNLLAVREDELVLLDEQTAIGSFIAAIPNHVLVPIAEDDAFCYSYLAHRSDSVSQSLEAFLSFVNSLKQEDFTSSPKAGC